MTTPANLTYSNIETRVANAVRIPTSNSVEMAKVQAIINEVYRDICAKQDWWWLVKSATLVNDIALSKSGVTATVRLTAGVATATLSNTFGFDPTGHAFQLTAYSSSVTQADRTDNYSLYRIGTYGGGLTLPLDTIWRGLTDTGGATFDIYDDRLELSSDCGKVLNVNLWGDRSGRLERIGIEDMSQLKITDVRLGQPRVYTVYDFQQTGDPTQVRMLWVHPMPDGYYRFEVWYKQNLNTELSGATQPFIPDDYRQVLVYGALSRAYPILLNDLERGQYYLSMFNDVMALMAAQQKEYASDHASIAPRDAYRTVNTRIRRRLGRGTLGLDWFGRLPIDP